MINLPIIDDNNERTWSSVWTRLVGLILLTILLARMDITTVLSILKNANFYFLGLAVALILPMIAMKTFRWRGLLGALEIRYSRTASFLSYLGSMFVGFVTPGRVGEFTRVWHVSQDCRVPTSHILASVLVDRLFDFSALLAVGMIGLLSIEMAQLKQGLGIMPTLLMLILAVSLVFLTRRGSFNWITRHSTLLRVIGRRVSAHGEWFDQLRFGLKETFLDQLPVSLALTVAAYSLLFTQSYLLARAAGIQIGFLPVTYAMALGSLVTLLPMSISGLGTREAAVIMYLGTYGVSREAALSFSLLVFITFYLVGGVIGAIAWWLKPIPLNTLRRGRL